MDNIEITDLTTLRASHEAVLTRAEAARVLRVDVRTVSRGIDAGDIPSVKVGRRILVPRERLLALLSHEEAA